MTGKTQWEAPQSPQSIPVDDAGTFIFAEEEADRVMPSRSAVLAAGRFDLHHGIMYQGGYRAAALALDRPHSWPRHKVGPWQSQILEMVEHDQNMSVWVRRSHTVIWLCGWAIL